MPDGAVGLQTSTRGAGVPYTRIDTGQHPHYSPAAELALQASCHCGVETDNLMTVHLCFLLTDAEQRVQASTVSQGQDRQTVVLPHSCTV